MRDPNRISDVLTKLEEVWRGSPDLRFGQLIVAAANLSGKEVICPEVFYLEDEDLLRGVAAYAAKKNWPNQPLQGTPAKATSSSTEPEGRRS